LARSKRFDRAAVYYVTDEFLDAYGDAIPKRPIWIRSVMQESGKGGGSTTLPAGWRESTEMLT
jgi:GH25 family lysozyme M1 (1,4-beta-N-acetylmuramidase)